MRERLMEPNFRLGRNTRVLQTSRSLFIPAIRDITRNKEKQEKRPWVSYLGARPMHRSTLTLGAKHPSQMKEYESIYKHYYEGNKDIDVRRSPLNYPSLFKSQWEYGTNDRMHFKTWSQKTFPRKYVDTAPLHQSRINNRWNNVNGLQMMSITDLDREKPNYETNYRLSHSRSSANSTFVPTYRKKPVPFDVITGLRRAETQESSYRRISGNRILSEVRKTESLPRLLG